MMALDSVTEASPASPKAFLCHSSEDKVLAERLARDLAAAGVDVWFDKWEIRPGDSLRRKIDAGIESATFFFALLTPSSLRSEWVQTELDAAMVQRIAGKFKIVPIVHEIENHQMPPTLAGIRWVRIDSETYDASLRDLIMVCHDVSSKPPVNAPPLWTQQAPLPSSRLSIDAQRLAALLSERSPTGIACEIFLEVENIKSTLNVDDQDVATAVDELEDLGWVQRLSDFNSSLGFHSISPTGKFFVDTASVFKGYDPAADAAALAAAAVNTGLDSIELATLNRLLGWEVRRLNAAMYYLVDHGGVLTTFEGGDSRYAYAGFMLSPKTRRFAKRG
jgi:hypothetical protein